MPSIINSDNGVVSGSSGLKTTGGNDGITAFQQNGTESARIDSSGNVGIGTSSPSSYASSRLAVVGGELGVSNTSDARIYLYNGTTQYALLYADSTRTQLEALQSKPLTFWAGAAERMRIDSSGNVGIGTSSPLSTAMLEVSRSTTVIPTATVTADNQVTGWRTRRTGGSYAYEYYMGIRENSTALDFYDNTANALRARINSSGNFLIGTSSTFDVTAGAVTQVSGAFAVYTAGSPNTLVSFYNSSQSARVGFIGSNGNSTQYNSGSDYRLKDNVTNMSGALSKISALRPVTFTWKVSPETGLVSGFIAHELNEVVPEAVSGEKDAMCADGVTPDYQMVDQSKLVPLLVAAIQEQQQMIQTLQEEVAALKAKV